YISLVDCWSGAVQTFMTPESQNSRLGTTPGLITPNGLELTRFNQTLLHRTQTTTLIRGSLQFPSTQRRVSLQGYFPPVQRLSPTSFSTVSKRRRTWRSIRSSYQ